MCDQAIFSSITFPIKFHIYLALADWGFGPSGFRSLQILAYADFSYSSPYARQQFLFRRGTFLKVSLGQSGKVPNDASEEVPPTFHMMTNADKTLWDLTEVSEEVLDSCPVDDLIASPDEL